MIEDVQGDGNCFYRCLFRIVSTRPELAKAFGLNWPISVSEDQAIPNLRASIAYAFLSDEDPEYGDPEYKIVESSVKTLLHLKFHERVKGLETYYPLLAYCKSENVDECIDTMYDQVKYNQNIFASSLEVEVVRERLKVHNVSLIILNDDVGDQNLDARRRCWAYDIRKILRTNCIKRSIAVLINQDNIHYKVVKFESSYLVDRDACIK